VGKMFESTDEKRGTIRTWRETGRSNARSARKGTTFLSHGEIIEKRALAVFNSGEDT